MRFIDSMQQQPLISIIVPVYNAELYLDECVGSIVNQSYRNLEIILVDDGSTDSSATLCDRWADADKRIRTIHQNNSGPSAARNNAIEQCTGNFITFVDSDDTIAPQYIETLYNNLVNTDADISSLSLNLSKSDHSHKTNKPVTMTALKAVENILFQRGLDNAVAGKLYKRHLWQSVRFRTGIYYEDLEVFYHLYLQAKRIVHQDFPLYFYRQHSSSRMGSFNLKRADVLDVVDEIEQYIFTNHPTLLNAAHDRKFSANMNILWLMSSTGISSQQIIDRCWNNIKLLRLNSLFNHHVRLKNKIGALTSFLGLGMLTYILSKFK